MDSDNIGDFLYLILIVVFGIIGFWANKKKKPVGVPQSKTQVQDIFDTLFPSDHDEPVKEAVYENDDEPDYESVSKVEPKPETVSADTSTSNYRTSLPKEGMSIHDDTYAKKITHTEISDQIKNMNPIKDGEIGQSESSVEFNLSDPEEIKKAIIYSEILKAKYIHDA